MALYPVADHPLLSGKYKALAPDPDQQEVYAELAETLLRLRAPAYTVPADVAKLTSAVVLQINFLLQQETTPKILATMSNATPGTATTYRDRLVDPAAWQIVCQVTGRRDVGFRPFGWDT